MVKYDVIAMGSTIWYKLVSFNLVLLILDMPDVDGNIFPNDYDS